LFTRNCHFQRFDQTLDYTSTSSTSDTFTITLTSVAGGTGSEISIDPNAFPH
jgi:hypothetical protein